MKLFEFVANLSPKLIEETIQLNGNVKENLPKKQISEVPKDESPGPGRAGSKEIREPKKQILEVHKDESPGSGRKAGSSEFREPKKVSRQPINSLTSKVSKGQQKSKQKSQKTQKQQKPVPVEPKTEPKAEKPIAVQPKLEAPFTQIATREPELTIPQAESQSRRKRKKVELKTFIEIKKEKPPTPNMTFIWGFIFIGFWSIFGLIFYFS